MLINADLVVDGRTPQSPVLAPDGRWVCYLLDGGLWIVATDGGEPRRVAEGTRPRWSADSNAVFFLTDAAQLFRLTIADDTVTELTDESLCVVDHLPLLGSAAIALIVADPAVADPIVVGVDEPRNRLCLLTPDGGVRDVDLGGRHVVEVRQRPDGGPLAVLTWESPDLDRGPRSVRLHLTGQGVSFPVAADARSLAWWQDAGGWHIGLVALTPPGLQAGTAVFDLTPSAGTLRNRTERLPMCPTALCETDSDPLVVLADGLDAAVGRLTPDGLEVVARHPGRLDDLTVSADGSLIAALTGGRYRSAEVHVGPPGGPLSPITDTQPELAGITFGRQEPLHYRATDGLDLDGLLVLPPGRDVSDGPFPLITIAHGGPYERYADRLQLSWAPSGQWLAAAGYAVFLPNPRGGQGHGHDFAAAVAGRVGKEEWTDILAGVDLLIDRGVADPDRLGIAGWSHGGYLAAWAVSQTGRFRAALVGAGIVDWGMLAATGENGQFEAALGGSTGWSGIGPHPHDAVSPISYASRIRTPVLIVHGAEDTNVPLGQAVYLHRALRHHGVPHELVVYPREGHRIRERAHRIDLLHRTRDWFDRRLSSSQAPSGEQPGDGS
ncbi:S9 family peptidase [Actinoplanes rectilineatus]|uniref:S9 family peptidase n=1 Tax=Actinoplanes rectilineatus TaxID=113571 RepID=UPI0005F28567|nr:prolyl oligopeptidase family serine peptidase [Actinoplanes rectilineatus]